MSISLVEGAAAALGPLRDEVIFVGGASVTLWLTDAAAPPPRFTKDVDVVVEVTTRRALHEFEGRLREQGFREDQESGIMCRWKYADGTTTDDLTLDVMPAEASLIGFTNRWFQSAALRAGERVLPSGTVIRAVMPPHLVATKLEAFGSRGEGDHLGSRDLEDIVTLVDGRQELVGEVAEADLELRRYLAESVSVLMADGRFLDALPGLVRPDAASQDRVETVILPRLAAIATAPSR